MNPNSTSVPDLYCCEISSPVAWIPEPTVYHSLQITSELITCARCVLDDAKSINNSRIGPLPSTSTGIVTADEATVAETLGNKHHCLEDDKKDCCSECF